MTDTLHHVDVDGLRLRVRTLGDGPHNVLLLHGWMASSRVWDDLLPHLDLRGRRLIVPDLRGSGGSGSAASTSGYGLVRFVADLVAILDALDVGSATVIGNSMGGQLALCLAAARPQRVDGVVGLCPVPTSGIPLPDDARGLFSTSGGDRGKQGTILGLAAPTMTDATKQRLLDDAGTIAPDVIAAVFAAWSAGADIDLGAITAPALIVGTDDPFLPPALLNEAVVGRISRGRFAHLPGPGHYPQVEAPATTAAILNAFLAR
ncbi:MAG TPA: alpha/beta hydrolase [Myxococcota bacterium]